jgi:hypothetical protein
MPLHGTCFTGAGVAWLFIAIFTQQSSIAVCATSMQAGAGIAWTAAPTRKERPVRTMSWTRIRMPATYPDRYRRSRYPLLAGPARLQRLAAPDGLKEGLAGVNRRLDRTDQRLFVMEKRLGHSAIRKNVSALRAGDSHDERKINPRIIILH